MEDVILLDKELTLLVNSYHSGFFDLFFFLFTSRFIWLPLYAALLWMIFKRQGGRGLVTVIFVGLIILVADQLTSGLMKPLIARLRPSHDDVMQYMVHVVNDYRGGLYGFASSHAANTFALAGFFAFVVRNRSLSFALFAWALLNCYGRVYQGVHFFGDIVVMPMLFKYGVAN